MIWLSIETLELLQHLNQLSLVV